MLSIIVPTYNEAKNIEELLTRLFTALKPNYTPYEVLIVDDNSPDGTGKVIDELAAEHGPRSGPRERFVQRPAPQPQRRRADGFWHGPNSP